jgi:hypothetical protein
MTKSLHHFAFRAAPTLAPPVATCILAALGILAALAVLPSASGLGSEPGSEPGNHSASESADHAPATEAKQIYACDFELAADADYDGWPDRWLRQRGHDYPDYLKIAIERPAPSDSAATSQAQAHGQFLQIQLDGGSAAATGPAAPVSPLYSFAAEARIRTDGLAHDVAWLELVLLDAHGKVVESYSSPRLSGTSAWQTVRIGPLTTTAAHVRNAALAVHVAPSNVKHDIEGSAAFDDLKLFRLPRMSLRTSSETNLYASLEGAEIVCEVAGISQQHPQLAFELFDHQGKLLAERRLSLTTSRKHETGEPQPGPREESPAVFFGQASWQPPLPDYGFYRVRVALRDEARGDANGEPTAPPPTILERTLTLAALRPLPTPAVGEFGWTLASRDEPLPEATLSALLAQVGVNWVKLPAWFAAEDTAEADRLARFAERLSINKIQMVGMLDQPPPELRDIYRDKGRLPIASAFLEPELWQPAIDPVMTRLALKVRWWQLGDDADASYVGLPQAAEKVGAVKQYLERFGRETRVGVTWRWSYESPPSNDAPWAFLSYRSDPDLTADELAEFLQLPAASKPVSEAVETSQPHWLTRSLHAGPKPRRPAVQKWLVINPLSRSDYALESRVHDLVTRMLAARIQGADALFVQQPFSDESGLLNADGTPGDLLLPWRTTATMLAGAKYLGQLQLPGGSVNHLFARDGRAVMMIWNAARTTEHVFLGDNVRQFDLWGREIPTAQIETAGFREQQLEVATLPTFVTGIHEPIARFQIGIAIETPQLASLFDRPQTVRLRLTNPFPQGAGGELRLHAPKAWEADPRPIYFKLPAGEEARQDATVTLHSDANTGLQDVRVEVRLQADREYHFNVHRTLEVGLDDVQVEMRTRLRADGWLIVELQLTNLTDDPLSFQATLFTPGRRREIQPLVDLGHGVTTRTFLLPDGEELLGQRLWLRCEETTGSRALNYKVIAER